MNRFASSSFWALGSLCLLLTGCPRPPEPMPPPEPLDRTQAPVAPPDRTKLPEAPKAATWELPVSNLIALPNGIKVWHRFDDTTPLVSFRMVIPRGASSDPAGKAGLTGLTADMLDEGAAGKTALQLGDAFQRLATDYGYSIGMDSVTLSLDMLSDQVAPSLQLLSDVVLKPEFPEAEFDRRKQLWLAQAMSRKANPNDARSLTVRRVLYGEGYGGLPPYGNEQTLPTITKDDVLKQYAQIFHPKDVVIVVVGAIPQKQLSILVRTKFGSWSAAPSATSQAVSPAPESKDLNRIFLVDFPGATQSSVSVARRVAGANTEAVFADKVFNWTLGGAFTSRLNLNLREDKGYTYGARSGFVRWRKAGIYGLSAQVKSETTAASVKEMLSEIGAISSAKPLTKTEYDASISGIKLGFPGRFERLAGIAGQLGRQASLGRPRGWLSLWPERIAAVTLPAAQKAANDVTKGDFVVVIAGDHAKLEASLGELGRAIVICKPDGRCE